MVLPKNDKGPSGFVERRRWPRQPASDAETFQAHPSVLKPLQFSTRELAPMEQFPAWQAHLAPIVDVKLPDDTPAEAGFPVDHTAWNLNDMLIVRQNAPAYRYVRSAVKLRSSSIDHWFVVLQRTGRAWTEVDGQVVEGGPGKVELRSLGFPFSGRMTEADTLFIYLPRDLFTHAAATIDANNNSVLSGNFASVLIDYVNSIEARLPTLTAEDLPQIVGTTRDMILACLTQPAEHASANEQQVSLSLLERARQYIQRNLDSPDLTPRALCRELGLSRTRVYELFEPSGGVLHYIQKRRLLAAHSALSDQSNNQRIADIAEAVGFNSAANFSRAFSNEFGYSPREARNMAPPVTHIRSDSLADRTHSFEEWLKMLGS